MAPLRSVEEIRSQIRVFESIMEREQRGINCMICRETYERSPEMLMTILKHTYCKNCIISKLQTDDASEFIIGVTTGWSANPATYGGLEISSEDSENETASVDSSEGVQSLPRGYVYPNSKFMQNVEEGIRSKKVPNPYSSLRMNAETQTKLKHKVQKGTGNKKGPCTSLKMNAKKRKAESKKRMRPTKFKSQISKRMELLHETGDDDRSRQSESVNKP